MSVSSSLYILSVCIRTQVCKVCPSQVPGVGGARGGGEDQGRVQNGGISQITIAVWL